MENLKNLSMDELEKLIDESMAKRKEKDAAESEIYHRLLSRSKETLELVQKIAGKLGIS